MVPMRDMGHLVNLVVTNFSGGKRHAGRGSMDGDALRGMACLAESVRTDAGFVLAIQEMTTDAPALATHAVAFEEALGSKARSSFVPRVSAAWYPLKEKWGGKIAPGGAHNEGLCVVTGDSGLVLAPWSSAPWPAITGPASVASPTRVLDLPNLSFPDTESGDPTGGEWLEASVVINETRKRIAYRPTFYRGTRDSDPRIAQACLLAWFEADHEPEFSPACLLINVHLSTLTTELQGDGTPGRLPTPEAIFLRGTQLDLIARYVLEVQKSAAGLPVVIAGDFNAEPGSPEMLAFSGQTGAVPLLSADRCWKCGTVQKERPKILFYAQSEGAWDFTIHPQSPGQKPKLSTGAVCSNDDCREARFSHKWHGQLLDNVFILRAGHDCPWSVTPGIPRVDVGWGYSDHAAIIVPLNFARRTTGASEVRI